MYFKDKVVVVTGSGKGIGRGVALAYAEAGAHVIIAEIEPDLADQTQRLIQAKGGQAVVILTDMSNPQDIIDLMKAVENQFGCLDILINNAGIGVWQSPYELTVEAWDYVINVNLRGIFLCSREAAKIMRKQKKGSIVNISSTRAVMSEPNSEAYAASKGGIVALTHALAASLSEDHIQVNCISPGWIENGDYTALREIDHEQHLSKKVGKPEDIARACLYLTSEGNNFVNGINLVVDGGMTRKMIYEP